jgi:RNA polymerase sigma-70 factor (ECF subfamily)
MEPKAADPSRSDSGMSPGDGELVRRTLDGKKEAFDELIRRHQRQAMAVSYRLLNNTHDAMEVTQDAFLKAFASLDTLTSPDAFAGWLMRIVSNLSLNYRRGRTLRMHASLDDVPEAEPPTTRPDDPARQLQSREMGQRLQECLAQLPEKQRLAITLFTLEKMPQKQVAEVLECSVEAVKWHVFQGRKKLKELMKDYL